MPNNIRAATTLNTMKKYIAILVAAFLVTTVWAKESTYSVTADFPYLSKYVFRGLQVTGASFQPSIRIDKEDAYFSVCLDQALASHVNNEVDFTVGKSYTMSDEWKLDAGVTLYYYPKSTKTFEGYLGLNGTYEDFTVGLYVYRDITLKSFTVESKAVYSVSINEELSISLQATLGTVVVKDGNYSYWGAGVSVPYKITDSTTFTVGVQYANHNLHNTPGNNVWGTATLTIAF
jgi:hypothetical protein